MKTSDLIGPALDWAVAKCEGYKEADCPDVWDDWTWEQYSTDWSQGGPIIEREKIQLAFLGNKWEAWIASDDGLSNGPTPLIAAMRCYVASKLGDEVEIPEELI